MQLKWDDTRGFALIVMVTLETRKIRIREIKISTKHRYCCKLSIENIVVTFPQSLFFKIWHKRIIYFHKQLNRQFEEGNKRQKCDSRILAPNVSHWLVSVGRNCVFVLTIDNFVFGTDIVCLITEKRLELRKNAFAFSGANSLPQTEDSIATECLHTCLVRTIFLPVGHSERHFNR